MGNIISINVVSSSIPVEDAKYYLKHTLYERQRPAKKRSIEKYATILKSGDFLPHSTISFVTTPTRTVLVDGQQRLNASIKAGVALVCNIQTITVDDEEMVHEIYTTFDSHSARTNKDLLVALGMENKLGISIQNLNAAVAAINLIKADFMDAKGMMTMQEQETQLYFYRQALQWYASTLSASKAIKPTIFRRAGVMGVGIVTLKYAFEEAEKFWYAVMNGDGDVGSPTYGAYRHITTTAIQASAKQKTVSTTYQARYIAACWNSFVEGKTTRPRISAITDPILILRTPFVGLDNGIAE